MTYLLLQADARRIPLADRSVHCVVTSPPYYGLRDYGTARWEGGDPGCDHKVRPTHNITSSTLGGGKATCGHWQEGYGDRCGKCGARRVDHQLGLEASPDEFVAAMVRVFRGVWRVLRDDGTAWVNLGDSYNSTPSNQHSDGVGANGSKHLGETVGRQKREAPGLKPKDLIGIPWSVAKALQAPFYAGKIAKEVDRVWLAATIDAEGSICGFTHVRKDDGTTRTGIHITITNTSQALLDNAFRIWPTSRKDHNPHGKGHRGSLDTFRWIAHNVDEKALLLRELYPYFIAKKKQALLAWNLLEISKTAKRSARIGESEETKGKRAWIVAALSRLNHMEDVDIPSWCKEPPGLFEPGWYLRDSIVWSKAEVDEDDQLEGSAMPGSQRDRCTSAYELVFLLAKRARYFYDPEGCKASSGAMLRNVWRINPEPTRIKHFATFPRELARRCIALGTSERGVCPECGAPWEREVESESQTDRPRSRPLGTRGNQPSLRASTGQPQQGGRFVITNTLGWLPTCRHAHAPIPATVFDPFVGSGTTLVVANALGRRAVGCDLSREYLGLARRRIERPHAPIPRPGRDEELPLLAGL